MQKPQAGKSTNPRIEHVVVLMLENRCVRCPPLFFL